MKLPPNKPSAQRLNRRAFLYGVGGLGIGLPFLESAPDRSAWAAGEEPVFALFMGTGNGIIAERFWPAALGPLTDLATEINATGILGDFAAQLIFARGLRYPAPVTADTHGQSYPQMLTGAPYGDGSPLRKSTAPSLDVILAPALNPAGTEPLTLYAGLKQQYINEAMSWTETGDVRAAQENPYLVYTDLLTKAGTAVDSSVLSQAALVRRQSAIDLARDELLTFQGRAGLSQTDRGRLEQHLSALRNIEQSLGDLVNSTCSTDYLDVDGITAFSEDVPSQTNVEQIAKLQLELAAFAFACNINHVATLQSGSGCDTSLYDVPSNARRWTFHHISHQIQSDGAAGDDPLAEQAHAEIDRLRVETLAHGLRQFDAHNLLDKSIVMWTNQFREGRSGSFSDLPYIIAGNPYGRLQPGQYIDCNNALNGELLTTIARVLGVDRLIGSAQRGLDELIT